MNNTGKKFGGREAGTPNKITKEIRNKLKHIIDSELSTLPEYLETIDKPQRVDILLKLIPYVLPKVNPIDHYSGEPVTFDF